METVPPPPPRSLPSSSSSSSVYLKFEFYLRNISWNADIEKKKKKKTLALNPAAAPEEPCGIKPPQRGKKVLLATQTWRNSSDMPVSLNSPTFPGSPAEHPGWELQTLSPAGEGGPRGARGWERGACDGGN